MGPRGCAEMGEILSLPEQRDTGAWDILPP